MARARTKIISKARSEQLDVLTSLGLTRNVTSNELSEAIKNAKSIVMTKQQRENQLVGYVWGNAPEGDTGTKETVRRHLNLL